MKKYNKCSQFSLPCAFPIPPVTPKAFTETSSFAANTTGPTINVIVLGTIVPLPNFQTLSGGITVNAANTIFTVPNTGRYFIDYQIRLTAGALVGSRLLINGSPNTPSTVFDAVNVTSSLENSIILPLNAGDTISLQLFGLLAAVLLLPGTVGATLTIIQIS